MAFTLGVILIFIILIKKSKILELYNINQSINYRFEYTYYDVKDYIETELNKYYNILLFYSDNYSVIFKSNIYDVMTLESSTGRKGNSNSVNSSDRTACSDTTEFTNSIRLLSTARKSSRNQSINISSIDKSFISKNDVKDTNIRLFCEICSGLYNFLLLLIVFILLAWLPLSIYLSNNYKTYTYSYSWHYSTMFLSGYVPAILLIVRLTIRSIYLFIYMYLFIYLSI